MQGTKVFKMREQVPVYAPDEYKQHAWEHMKREVGIKLYGLLEQEKNPIVVEINENVIVVPHLKDLKDWAVYYNYEDILEIEVLLTAVQYRNVEFIKPPTYNWHKVFDSPNLYQRIKRKFSWLKLP